LPRRRAGLCRVQLRQRHHNLGLSRQFQRSKLDRRLFLPARAIRWSSSGCQGRGALRIHPTIAPDQFSGALGLLPSVFSSQSAVASRCCPHSPGISSLPLSFCCAFALSFYAPLISFRTHRTSCRSSHAFTRTFVRTALPS
jgi:hypothetical protein